jgi:predicted O-methyltransferase YrrM
MTKRYTFDFVLYLTALRPPRTSVTAAERDLLRGLAAGCRSLVEVGVHEGATSVELCRAMHPEGIIHLVDPFVPGVRAERWLHLSFARFIARRATRPWHQQVRFVRTTSLEAAKTLELHRPADLVFIDADHSYDSVRADFLAWAKRLATDGVITLHDSRSCAARPDLGPDAGPIRLVDEIAAGRHGSWHTLGQADSLTAFRLAEGAVGGSTERT